MSEVIRAWLLKPILDFLHSLQRTIIMNQAELEQALQAAIATAGNSTPEVDAALARLQAARTTADDLNPDA